MLKYTGAPGRAPTDGCSYPHVVQRRCGQTGTYDLAGLLVLAVHDRDNDAVTKLLHELGPTARAELAVALASLVPDDQPVSSLLAWNNGQHVPTPALNLHRHGSHGAYNLHRRRGTEPCAACWDAERDYQRNRVRTAS